MLNTTIDESLIEAGGQSMYMFDTEMFHSSIQPLGFNDLNWTKTQWSVSKNDYEQIEKRTSMSGFELVLKRSPIPFLMNVYLPTSLLTIISFIGFVIPVDLVPGRMALLVTIFLMLVNMSSTERNKGPRVRTGRG